MPSILSDIQERVENTVVEYIRRELVAHGYLPDILNYIPETLTSKDAYMAEKKAIVNSKGFVVELFGHSSSDKKYSKSVPRITFLPRRFVQGDIGNSPEKALVLSQDEAGYDEFFQPPTTSDYWFDIEISTNSASQDRICHAILMAALGKRKYIDLLYGTVNPAERVLVEHMDEAYSADDVEGVINRVYIFRIIDLYETALQPTGNTVSKLKEVDLEDTTDGLEAIVTSPANVVIIVNQFGNQIAQVPVGQTYMVLELEGVDGGNASTIYSNEIIGTP